MKICSRPHYYLWKDNIASIFKFQWFWFSDIITVTPDSHRDPPAASWIFLSRRGG
jgi:hypothetical protein